MWHLFYKPIYVYNRPPNSPSMGDFRSILLTSTNHPQTYPKHNTNTRFQHCIHYTLAIFNQCRRSGEEKVGCQKAGESGWLMGVFFNLHTLHSIVTLSVTVPGISSPGKIRCKHRYHKMCFNLGTQSARTPSRIRRCPFGHKNGHKYKQFTPY